jgi:hypothetical protein
MTDDARGPIVAPRGEPPARASRPDQVLDPRFQTYESNPAPWWIALLWASFFVFGVAYLLINLISG